MKSALPLFTLALAAPMLIANGDPPSESAPLALESLQTFDSLAALGPLRPRLNCTDTIEIVRQERGLPLIDRQIADADAPILFNAVDYDIDGCDVLLTSNGEIRPLPLVPEGPVTPQPAQ